jgi:hypothetical protein
MRSLLRALVIGILLFSVGSASAQVTSLVPTNPDGAIQGAAGTQEEIYSDVSAKLMGLSQCSFKYGTMHFSCIIPYVGYLLKAVIFIGTGICLFTIVLAGYRMAVGSIVEAQREEGKKMLIRALVGFSIMILSYFLVDTVIQALT